MITRFLSALFLAGLTGCATLSTGLTVSSTALSQLQALATGLASIAGTEAGIFGASPEIVAKINADVALAQTAAGEVTTGEALFQAQSNVQTVETEINEVLSLATAAPIPPQAKVVALALQVALPVVEAAFGLPAPAAAEPAGLTADEAFLILRAAH